LVDRWVVSVPMPLLGIRKILALCIGLGFLAGAALYCPAAASGEEKGLEFLTRATKSYASGSYDDSLQLIDSAFKSGLSGEFAARAILLRAQINERTGAMARALQDYSNALWMGNLPDSEKREAALGKERVMAAMGLGSQSASEPSRQPEAPRQAAASAPVRTAAQPESQSGSGLGFFGGLFGSNEQKAPAREEKPPVRAAAAPEPSSGGVFGFLGGIFGSDEEKREAASTQQTQAPAAPKKVAADPAAAKAAAAKTAAAKTAAAKAASKQASVAKPAAAPIRVASAQPMLQPASALSVAASADGFWIVFGAVNNEASGRATAQQIKAKLADILVNRQLDVAAGSGGGYQVQAGPYKAKSAALALCSAMKQRGVPCQVTP
jgi:hypothetical protein